MSEPDPPPAPPHNDGSSPGDSDLPGPPRSLRLIAGIAAVAVAFSRFLGVLWPAAASPAIVEATPPAQNDSATGARSRVANGPFHASPAIRRFARELGVNFALVDPIP